MAQQTAVEWLVNELIFKSEYEHLQNNYFLMSDKDIDKIIVQGKEIHKAECISFAEQWELRCNEGNMDSKEQLYNETFNK
jgi:hypothetical protein